MLKKTKSFFLYLSFLSFCLVTVSCRSMQPGGGGVGGGRPNQPGRCNVCGRPIDQDGNLVDQNAPAPNLQGVAPGILPNGNVAQDQGLGQAQGSSSHGGTNLGDSGSGTSPNGRPEVIEAPLVDTRQESPTLASDVQDTSPEKDTKKAMKDETANKAKDTTTKDTAAKDGAPEGEAEKNEADKSTAETSGKPTEKPKKLGSYLFNSMWDSLSSWASKSSEKEKVDQSSTLTSPFDAPKQPFAADKLGSSLDAD